VQNSTAKQKKNKVAAGNTRAPSEGEYSRQQKISIINNSKEKKNVKGLFVKYSFQVFVVTDLEYNVTARRQPNYTLMRITQ